MWGLLTLSWGVLPVQGSGNCAGQRFPRRAAMAARRGPAGGGTVPVERGGEEEAV